MPVPAPEESADEEVPGSPIEAAASSAASPDTADMTQGGASAATVLIPEGLSAMPSAAADSTRSGLDDDTVDTVQAELMAEIAVAAATMAGPLTREERADLIESLREVPALEDFDRYDLQAIEERLDPSAEEYAARMEERLEEIAGSLTDPALRRAAYQLAVYFCAWDGTLSDEEQDLLAAMAEAFEIPDQEAAALREATIMDSGVDVWGVPPGAAP
jgi:tellurite resistance protein